MLHYDKRKTFDEIVELINMRFKSGNSIPVERAHLTFDEWQVILSEIKAVQQ